jgi:hypothetical protein
MWLLEEAGQQGIRMLNARPKVHCKVFEDNAGAIEIANVPKMRPRTKHLNIKYHHFREVKKREKKECKKRKKKKAWKRRATAEAGGD